MQDNLTAKGDFPHTYGEFVQEFLSNDACATFLEQLRWPAGFCCPACQAIGVPWRQTRGRLVCCACRHQTSVTTGTILEKTRTPLTTWFEAAWHLTTAKNGLSAKTLERTLGSHRTAWAMLQRFRAAMVRSERERLSGAVEVKEPEGFGRVRIRHVPDASGANRQPFICDVMAQGANVRTDGWTGYNGLSKHGYLHERVVLSWSGDPAHVSMPGVHRIASLLIPLDFGHTSRLCRPGSPPILLGGVHISI